MRAQLVNASALTKVRHSRISQRHDYHPKQHFLTASAPRSFTITRTLPYAVHPVYEIIADISSYHTFIPYCSSSAVTAWSKEDLHGRGWPAEARIAVSWHGLSEEWGSRVRCEPERVVEAVTNIPRGAIQNGFGASSAIKSLKARWTLTPVEDMVEKGKSGAKMIEDHASQPQETVIKLEINYAFTNAIYEAMGARYAPKVAGMIVEAFEKRAKFLLRTSGTSR